MNRVKGDVFKGQQHADTWLLEFRGAPKDAAGGDAAAAAAIKPEEEWAWVKIKCSGAEPNLRSGAAMTLRTDGKAYSFGGAVDTEEEDEIDSTFFNDLYVVDVTKRPTWHIMNSGAPPPGGAAAAAAADAPSPRLNAHLCVQGSVLWVYGGSIEHGSRHVTLSDLHCLELSKKSSTWTQVHGHDRKTAEWLEEESSSESESEDEDAAAAKKPTKGKKGPNPLKAKLAATPGGFPKGP